MTKKNSLEGNKKVCTECGETFTWRNSGDVWPGGKDREYIYCPYCHAENGSIMTSGAVITAKVSE
ncbi:hypothetical protein IGK74_000411 [Enterococcus sp. AZ150]|uniref:hypothetical protein n=1 Tax=Enterococcus sp. AZ150 TaxID=2774866 RepID=UPI003F1EE629